MKFFIIIFIILLCALQVINFIVINKLNDKIEKVDSSTIKVYRNKGNDYDCKSC